MYKFGRLGSNYVLVDTSDGIKYFNAGGIEILVLGGKVPTLAPVSVISYISDGRGCELYDGVSTKVFMGNDYLNIVPKLFSKGIVGVPLRLNTDGYQHIIFVYGPEVSTSSIMSSL